MKEQQIVKLLPEVFQRTWHQGNVLQGYLAAMVGLISPVEKVLDDLNTYFNPRMSEEKFVILLSRWVDMETFLEEGRIHYGAESDRNKMKERADKKLSTGLGRLRELVAHAIELARMRGTIKGMTRFLEIATGCRGFKIKEQTSSPFHIEIIAPAASANHHSLINRIIEREKPAYVTCKWLIEEETH